MIKIDTNERNVTNYLGYDDTWGEKLAQYLEAFASRLVRFTINGTPNYAVEGMTWNEFASHSWDTSVLNTPSINTTDDGYLTVYDNDVEAYCTLHYPNGEQVHMSDVVANHDYVAQAIEQENYTVSGTWLWDDKIPMIDVYGIGDLKENVSFVSNGTKYGRFEFIQTHAVYYDDTMAAYGAPGYVTNWKVEAYRTITFDGTQTVSKGFYKLLTANAVFAFTIDGTTYYAKEGMTWGEWVESEYNTGGYKAPNGYYIIEFVEGTGFGGSGGRVKYEEDFQTIHDVIIVGTNYTVEFTEAVYPDKT